MRLALIVAVIALVAAAPIREAHALGPVDVEAGLEGGIGSKLNDFGGGAANPKGGPLGTGFGVRAGVVFAGLYGGVTALYYLGSDQYSAPATFSAHSFVYGIQAGYGRFLGDHVIVRGQLGVGDQVTSSTSSTPGIADVKSTNHYLYLEPGVTLLFVFDSYFFGGDANVYVLPHVTRAAPEAGTTWTTATGFTLHLQAGLRF